MFIAAALVCCALGMSSCGDTKHCYTVTLSADGKEISSTKYFATSNEITAIENDLKAVQEKIFGEGKVKVSHTWAAVSEEDCKGGSIKF